MLKLLVPTLLWSINDTQAELLTAELRPNALVLHSEAEFRAGSATANALKGMKPSTFKDLGRMPVNQLVYLGMDTSPGMLKALGTCMYDMMGVTQGKAAREAMEEMAQAGASSRVDAMTLPVTGLDVWECKDPARVVTAQLKLWEAMAKSDAFKASSFFKRPRIKLKARKYGDIEFNAVTISWDREKAAARGGKDAGVVQMLVMEGLAKFVFIGQEFTYWFGSDGKSYVQVMAWDWATARKLLDQYFKGKKRVGDVANFHAARKELPAEASFLMLLDASRSAICIQKFLTWWAERLSWGSKSTVEFPDTTPNPTAPFLGLAVTLQPQRGSFDIVLTAPAAKEFYNKVVKPIVRAPGG